MVLVFKFNLFEELGEEDLGPRCKDQQLIIYFPKYLRERIFKNWSFIVLCLSSWSSSRIKRTSKGKLWKASAAKIKFKLYAPIICHFMDQKLLQFSLNLYNVWTQRRNVQFRLVFNIRHDYFTTKISKSWINCFGAFPSCILCYIENWLHLRSFVLKKHYGKLWAK